MTDRELLEGAAKAAGMALDWDSYTAMNLHRPMASHGEGQPFRWNPLTDDGDALRLAVKLELPIHHSGNFAIVYAGKSVASASCAERIGGDRLEATRRAIVRAAAVIGAEGKS